MNPASRKFQVCLVLCGLPASGKSTLASALAGEGSMQPVVVVDVDATRDARYRDLGLGDAFLPSEESIVRQGKLDALSIAIGEGKNVIDDDMNYYRSMRKETVDLCCERKVHYGIIHVRTPLRRCLQWNEERGTLVPADLVRDIHGRFDKPGSRAYAWDAPLASINLAKTGVDRAVSSIVTMLSSLSPGIASKEKMHAMLGDASSVMENPAFWSLAKIDDIVRKGYLVDNVKEWREKLDPRGGSILEAFDLSCRRLINERVKAAGPLTRAMLGTIKHFKQRARSTLKTDPAQLQPLLEELKAMLRDPG